MLIHIGVTHLLEDLFSPNSVNPIIFRNIAVDFLPELSYKYNSHYEFCLLIPAFSP